MTHMQEFWVPMRDGVKLFSRLHRAEDAAGTQPAVLMRNPYNSGIAPPIWDPMCADLAMRGFAVINQDVRGTNRSEGVFRPFLQEGEDGHDAIEWVARQPWCDGRVGIWGISYLGACALQAAILRPPSLVAVAAQVTASDYHDHWVYENGLLNSLFIDAWTGGFAQDERWRRERSGDPTEDGRPAFWAEWMQHPLHDDYWRASDLTERCREIDVPVLLTGGWFDIFAQGTITLYRGLAARGSGAVTRLRMTPGCHGPWTSEVLRFPGVLDAPPDMDPAWWEHWLKGDAHRGLPGAPVRVHVMAPPLVGALDEGRALELPNIPADPPRLRFALASEGEARGGRGGARLVRNGAPAGPPDTFVHDPSDPVPTRGGPLATFDPAMPAGVVDQAALAARDDVLVYRTPALDAPLTMVGAVRLVFWASSTGDVTQFAVKLGVARPDGSVLNFLDRMVGSDLREGSRGPVAPAPAGAPSRYEVELGHTALHLRPGLRLELHIAASNFPRFAAGTPDDPRAGAGGRQMQTVLHDADHPSWLEVALLPNCSGIM